MRVLIVSWEYPPNVVGGMGKHVAELVPALGGQMLADGPLYVDVVTTRLAGGAQEEQVNEFVTIYRVDVPPIDPVDHYNSVVESNQALVERAERLAQKHPYDLIHAHDWLVAKAGIALKHSWKTPYLTTMHATERGRHQGHIPSDTSHQIDRMEWQSCFEAWTVIACSQFMQNELESYFGLPSSKVAVIPNGINAEKMARCPADQRALLRHRYAPNGERLLLFVGRIVHEKGVHVLIRAMPRILAEHPEARLLVAGKNGEKYWPLAYELGVEKAITFLGYISDEERDCLYSVVDAAIFPSLYEPFGIVALEAMAAGSNVIASSVGGLAEVVRHKENGLTCYANDPMSIVWAVDKTLSDPAAAEARRKVALAEVKDLYGWPRIARQTAELYESVANERRATEW
ncbi:MAG: glycosyltransferase family 4 protein [Caldilinea sp.]|nr:glycosyltransferase family 4 protein [Caldilineaceae bacterium]MCW5843568.1 glycosyltransferase family 4 protein [Caldilinea sp.]HRW47790.1 glycosyltransferase family 4 protein [Caldilinea sp.]